MDIDEKVFELKKRDGSKAEFRFTKQEGVWYWDLPHKATKMVMPSLPLPDVNLDECDTLKKCLDAVAEKRKEDWVAQVYADIMKS